MSNYAKLLVIFSVVLASFPMFAIDFEYTYKGHTLTYTIIDANAGTCMTKAGDWESPGNNAEGDLEIPSVVSFGVRDFSVVAIADFSFNNCEDLNSI